MTREWEPSYGFCGMNENTHVQLASALEIIRRRICQYGGGQFCDCKYGIGDQLLTVEEAMYPANKTHDFVPTGIYRDKNYKQKETGAAYEEVCGICHDIEGNNAKWDSKAKRLHAGGADYKNSEASGCPELREVINRLLHRPDTFVEQGVLF